MTPTPNPLDPLVDAIAVRVAALLRPQLAQQQEVRPRILSVEKAAVYLGRTEKAVRNLIAAGTLAAVRSDGRVMLDVQDLDRWIDHNKV